MISRFVALGLMVLGVGCQTAKTKAPLATKPASLVTNQPRVAVQPPTEASSTLLFPERTTGWKAVDAATRVKIDNFADAYSMFLARAKTVRATVKRMDRLLGPIATGKPRTGGLIRIHRMGGKVNGFVRVGQLPLSRGLRLVVVPINTAHIELRPAPVYRNAGLVMLDTVVQGKLDPKSWLSHPLSLHIAYQKRGKLIQTVIGENPADPVLVIPDLLPHLAGHVQRDRIVDSPKRLGAILDTGPGSLPSRLATRGLSKRVLATAEAALVPAGRPTRIGVDRALISGYGHSHRALAFAAVRAVQAVNDCPHTVVVVLLDQSNDSRRMVIPAVRTLVADVVMTLAKRATDQFGFQQILSRSRALTANSLDGKLHGGLILNPGDELPEALRYVAARMSAANAHIQLAAKASWRGSSRIVSQLDIQSIDIALPSKGLGSPTEVISILDLYHGYLALQAWIRSD